MSRASASTGCAAIMSHRGRTLVAEWSRLLLSQEGLHFSAFGVGWLALGVAPKSCVGHPGRQSLALEPIEIDQIGVVFLSCSLYLLSLAGHRGRRGGPV